MTYSSRYVSKLSEVSNNLNVSGSLSIRYGEISGGGSGSYVDAEVFQQSDINFLVVVKVINQTINIKDQLQFWPLDKDTPIAYDAKKFTDIYGDSFISGFQEGGQFSAIVSIKALDASKLMEIKANAHLALQVGVGSLQADADVELAKKNLNSNSEVTITVNWSGGGQLKSTLDKWTIDTLQTVAAKFPELVANCPQRTHAILTKYTALRGYLQWRPKDELQPLDYEVAALYTSELLDIYMDYKTIWKEIHEMLHALEVEDDERPALVKAPPLAHPVREPDIYNEETKQWEPGELIERFSPDFQGLDWAFRICRRLMVRIVDENDEISRDPALAVDKKRPLAYLRPQLFRRLLPIRAPTPSVDVSLAKADFAFSGQTKSDAEQKVPCDANQTLPPDIVVGIQGADLGRGADRVIARLSINERKETRFNCACTSQSVDKKVIAERYSLPASALLVPINDEGVQVGTLRVTETPKLVEVAPSDVQLIEVVTDGNPERIQSGDSKPPLQTSSEAQPEFQTWSKRVNFANPYESGLPAVVVFLSGFEVDSSPWANVCVSAKNIDRSGFDVVVTSLQTSTLVDVSWFACPTGAPNVLCGSSDAWWTNTTFSALTASQPQKSFAGHVRYAPRTFSAPPQVFYALRGFAMGRGRNNVRINTEILDMTRKGLNWKVGTWADTELHGVALSWVIWQK